MRLSTDIQKLPLVIHAGYITRTAIKVDFDNAFVMLNNLSSLFIFLWIILIST